MLYRFDCLPQNQSLEQQQGMLCVVDDKHGANPVSGFRLIFYTAGTAGSMQRIVVALIVLAMAKMKEVERGLLGMGPCAVQSTVVAVVRSRSIKSPHFCSVSLFTRCRSTHHTN